jgi:hypothetical protein
MSMTPRQIMGWLYFVRRCQDRRQATALHTGAMAARGEPRKINALIAKVNKDQ